LSNPSDLRSLSFEDVGVNTEITPIERKISIVGNAIYSAATWDFYCVHYDREFARQEGFSAPFADGQMLGALLAEMLTSWTSSFNSIKRLKLRYKAMVFVGDSISCGGRVTQKTQDGNDRKITCDLWIHNQRGEDVITDSSATLSLPIRNKRSP
jgi:acyl dehydratase